MDLGNNLLSVVLPDSVLNPIHENEIPYSVYCFTKLLRSHTSALLLTMSFVFYLGKGSSRH